jgi:hypothetical protein
MKSRSMRLTGHAAQIYGMRNEYRMFVEEPDKKRVFGGNKHRWEYNIKTDTKEIIKAKLGEMVYGDQSITMKSINYVMNHIYRK